MVAVAGIILCSKLNVMVTMENINYSRVADAINYLQNNFREQPDLDAVAGKVNLSPFHFQRLFTDWAGVSPKKFLQFLTVGYAKEMLQGSRSSLSDTAFEAGLSGTGRLHDLFINLEGMTPGEYKQGGENLSINFSFAGSPFGNLLVASTPKGICHMSFTENEAESLGELKSRFPNAKYRQVPDQLQQDALYIFTNQWEKPAAVKLHLKATPFQLKVWETLLRIPMGQLASYGEIATRLNNPNASRAVGSAIGDNPVAYLIPCHRVIQSTGRFGQYHWGSTRKTAMIGWEAARVSLAG
jgi:AraC family transcriptional regulator of adaptative response/methylated-DNA-[protein]-cysteine methyltransferase